MTRWRRSSCRLPRSNPSSSAIASGSRPSDEPASAPEPYGDTAARSSKSAIRSTSRSSGCAWASRWCASRIGCADCRCVLPGMIAVGCDGGLGGQCGDDLEHAVGDPADRVAQPHPEQRGHLVVSRPTGPQPAAEVGADPVDQAALERAVHVLVGDAAGRSCRRRRRRRGCPARPAVRRVAPR